MSHQRTVVARPSGRVYHLQGPVNEHNPDRQHVTPCGMFWYGGVYQSHDGSVSNVTHDHRLCAEWDARLGGLRPCMKCFPGRYHEPDYHQFRSLNTEHTSRRLVWL